MIYASFEILISNIDNIEAGWGFWKGQIAAEECYWDNWPRSDEVVEPTGYFGHGRTAGEYCGYRMSNRL